MHVIEFLKGRLGVALLLEISTKDVWDILVSVYDKKTLTYDVQTVREKSSVEDLENSVSLWKCIPANGVSILIIENLESQSSHVSTKLLKSVEDIGDKVCIASSRNKGLVSEALLSRFYRFPSANSLEGQEDLLNQVQQCMISNNSTALEKYTSEEVALSLEELTTTHWWDHRESTRLAAFLLRRGFRLKEVTYFLSRVLRKI